MVCWGERGLSTLTDGGEEVKQHRDQPVSPATVPVPGEAWDKGWIEEGSTLAAHS